MIERAGRRLAAHPTALSVLILALLWTLFFWQLLTPSRADRVLFAEGDFTLHFYAFSDYQAERVWAGQIPLWNPYNYGGDPFAANPQLAVWYPLRWASLLLAGPHGWSVEVLQLEVAAHYGLVSLMMLAFLRALTGRPFPALIGSVIWTYSGYLTGYPLLQPSVLRAAAWLPLLMLGAHLSVTRPRWRVGGAALAAAMVGLSILGGHPQTTLLMVYLAAAYIIVIGWQHGIRWLGMAWRIALLGVGGALLAAVQLLPSAEMLARSYRAEDFHYLEKSLGFSFPELAQVMWPRLFAGPWWPLYIGVVGLLLALATLLRPRREVVFWWGAALVGVWLSLGGLTIVYDALYLLAPGLSLFRQQERAAVVIVFALAVLATYGAARLLDRWPARDAPDDRRFTRLARAHLILALAGFVAAAFALGLRGKDPNQDTANALGLVALISLLLNAWLRWGRSASRLAAGSVLLALVVADLFTLGVNSPNFVPDTPSNRPQPPDFLDVLRVPVEEIAWHVDGAAGIEGRSMLWRIPDIYGVHPFMLATVEKLRQIRVDRRWEVLAVRYATMFADVPDNVPLTALGDGVNYDGRPYTLYELANPRPFAHLVYQARVADDGQRGAHAIMAEPWIDLREIAVLTEPLAFELPGARPDLSRVDAFKMVMPEYLEMQVSTGADALLTLALANYPGWHAELNGKSVEIVDTYAGLIGVPIRAGENQKVTLRFLPDSLLVGAALSVAAWAALAVYAAGAVVGWRRTSHTALARDRM